MGVVYTDTFALFFLKFQHFVLHLQFKNKQAYMVQNKDVDIG